MKIEARKSKLGGRGVFATADIKKGEVIERAEVIDLKPEDRKHIDRSTIFNYYFIGNSNKEVFLALGFGSLYNHADDPNAITGEFDSKHRLIYRARKPIKKGEEILIHYYDRPGEVADLWFEKRR